MNVEKAITYIQRNGSPLHQLRLRCALGEPFSLIEAEEVLTPYQFPDGSWDYSPPEEEPDRIGSLGGTIHCLRWIREFGLSEKTQMLLTLKFLSSIQAKDGSFYETEAKLAHSSQEWLQEESLVDQFYLQQQSPCASSPLVTETIPLSLPHWSGSAISGMIGSLLQEPGTISGPFYVFIPRKLASVHLFTRDVIQKLWNGSPVLRPNPWHGY